MGAFETRGLEYARDSSEIVGVMGSGDRVYVR